MVQDYGLLFVKLYSQNLTEIIWVIYLDIREKNRLILQTYFHHVIH